MSLCARNPWPWRNCIHLPLPQCIAPPHSHAHSVTAHTCPISIFTCPHTLFNPSPLTRHCSPVTTHSCRTEAREELRRQVGTLRFDLNTLAGTKAKEAKKDALAARTEFIRAVSGQSRSIWS